MIESKLGTSVAGVFCMLCNCFFNYCSLLCQWLLISVRFRDAVSWDFRKFAYLLL